MIGKQKLEEAFRILDSFSEDEIKVKFYKKII
jgi:hypothetical protein